MNSLTRGGIDALYILLRWLLALRYRTEVKDPQQVLAALEQDYGRRGILFLPNHVAYIDPVLLMSFLGRKFRTRPAMTEETYTLPIVCTLMKAIGTLPVPDFSLVANAARKEEYLRTVEEEIAAGLQRNESFLFYPSGRLKRQVRERLGGSSGAYRLLQNCGDAHVVLVKISGLWGSRFSCGQGKLPDFLQQTVESLGKLLKAGIFFLPKRKVTLEFAWAPPQVKTAASRRRLNRALEQWYNGEEEEPRSLVPYSPWDTPKVAEGETVAQRRNVVSPSTAAEIVAELSRLCGKPAGNISLQDELGMDLGLDSIEIAEVIAKCRRDLEGEELHTLSTKYVEDLMAERAHFVAPERLESEAYLS